MRDAVIVSTICFRGGVGAAGLFKIIYITGQFYILA